MKLTDYIIKNHIDKRKFAIEIGVSQVSLTRYLARTRRPEWHVLARIAYVTKGAVMPNDFLMPDEDQAA